MSYLLDGEETRAIAPDEDPEGWLRARWTDFIELEQKILALQRRARNAAMEAESADRPELAEEARDVIRNVGRLYDLYGRVRERLRGFGLGAFWIPVGALGVSSLALLVLWIFRRYAHQAEVLRMIEAGDLSPEQAAALDPGPAPFAAGLAGAGGLATLALLGLLAWGLFSARRPNPPLQIWGNPPHRIGSQVYRVEYRHAEDGNPYFHDFKRGVRMDAMDDGSVRIFHPVRPVWQDF